MSDAAANSISPASAIPGPKPLIGVTIGDPAGIGAEVVIKALADRLAEAYAELLHERARKQLGYGQQEQLTNEELIAEKYRGIRPAFGYPACPDHTEKRKLVELLQAGRVGLELTDNLMMTPPSSVSGLYLSHPESRYFAVGRIGRDQLQSYATRKRLSVAEAEKWLRPNLGYD